MARCLATVDPSMLSEVDKRFIKETTPHHPDCTCADQPLPRCTWILATGRCTNPATNGDVCCPCEDARDKRRD